MSESMIVGGVDLGDEAALPTEPGFYSETHIYPALGWYLDKRGDWHFIFATGRSENRGKTGPLDSGLIVNGKPVGELFRLIPASEVTGKHAPNRHSLPPRTGAQSQGGKLHQCDSEGTQDAQQCNHTPADQLVHPVVDGTCGKCWQVIDALKPHHEALNNPMEGQPQ